MRSSDLFGFFLLFLLDFWRPVEGLCSLKNGTIAHCHYLEDVRYINTYELNSLKASVAEKALISAAFQNVTSLRHLDLSGGELEEIHPGSFFQLKKLISLNLAENHIKHLHSSSLEGLKDLHYLNLRRNFIHHLPQAVLHLKNLRVLDISGNPLECNCATLKARDKLIEKGVKIIKRTLCTGPISVKGKSFLKPSTNLICNFEVQDKEMQMDQPMVKDGEGSGDLGSGEEEPFEDEDKEDDLEDVESQPESPEIAETPSPETPSPAETSESAETFDTDSSLHLLDAETSKAETSVPETPLEVPPPTSNLEESTSVSPVEVSLEKSKLKGDDGLFFDTDEKPATENPTVFETEKSTASDDLVPLVEGSGDDDEFEGSGIRVPHIDYGKIENESVFEGTKSEAGEESLFETLFGSWENNSTTAATPEDKTKSDIEKEEFLPVIPMKSSEAEGMIPKMHGSVPYKSDFDLPDIKEVNETKNVETKQEIADASSQDTKMGNGSMIVLIVLLVIFVALVVLAAYKGDFCKKKGVPDDVERGTELKEMRKSLLDGGNVQPKISSNGNMESVPLMNAAPLEGKDSKSFNGNGSAPVDGSKTADPSSKTESAPEPASAPESPDPVKPPRKSIPHEEFLKSPTNGKSNPEPNIYPELKFRNIQLNDTKTPPNTPMTPMDFKSPPLSPDAQRVKIILQENPDSVPKTPILITRTKMGENLIKTPKRIVRMTTSHS